MLRVLDANLNRIGEGLRLLEDVSRFVLNDAGLSQQLKSMRHGLLPRERALQQKLLDARDIGSDVGASLTVESEGVRSDLPGLVSANARRVEQSLRVLEEMAKLPDRSIDLDWNSVERARFTLYEIEKAMVLKLSRQDRAGRIRGLYLIVDSEWTRGRSEIEVARSALEGGVSVVQLRDKKRGKRDMLMIACQIRELCSERGVPFIMNDHLDIALASDAPGLHLGQRDLPLDVARRLLPGDRLLGCSTATVNEALEAQKQGADYIAVGSIYSSPSKEDTRPAGLETLRQVKAQVSLPIVAIGGINEHNVADVIAAGADAVAVIGAVAGADDVRDAARRIAAKFDER
jgi:thiamine-phosphate pyrophosphorylase